MASKWKWSGFGDRVYEIPDSAGIYCLFYGKELLYIGQSRDVKQRLMKHIHPQNTIDEDDDICWVFEFGRVKIDGKSLLSIKYRLEKRFGEGPMGEMRLINRLKPRFNKRMG